MNISEENNYRVGTLSQDSSLLDIADADVKRMSRTVAEGSVMMNFIRYSRSKPY